MTTQSDRYNNEKKAFAEFFFPPFDHVVSLESLAISSFRFAFFRPLSP
jgi:hypothetical protein